MLRIGLTGGIGSGKSTVARRLVERGAVLVDSDALAREVVAAGSDGLAEVVAAFGEHLLGADGELDRPALARIVFGDADSRARLNAIMHPLVRARSDALVAAAPEDGLLVQDIPLLVENGAGPFFPLVVVVHTDVEVRVRRLVEQRGMPEDDARARIAAQASDDARRASADVWLDNGGTQADLVAAVDELVEHRLLPFEENLRLRRPASAGGELVPDAGAPARTAARVAAAAGSLGHGVDHIGPGAVPGPGGPGPVQLQLGVAAPGDVESVAEALSAVGLPRLRAGSNGVVDGEGVHGSADPGQAVDLRVRVIGSPGWRDALLLRDWLRAVPEARAAVRYGSDGGERAAVAHHAASSAAEKWAVSSGWSPSLG